jgi:hypothetical protein
LSTYTRFLFVPFSHSYGRKYLPNPSGPMILPIIKIEILVFGFK